MRWDLEKTVDYYHGEYKKGLLGKKYNIEIYLYPSRIEGEAINIHEEQWSNSSTHFEITFDVIEKIYENVIRDERVLKINYKVETVVGVSHQTIIFPGLEDINKWISQLTALRDQYMLKQKEKQQLEIESKEKQQQMEIEVEENALKFYQNCYSFHIKEDTPIYPLFEEKNKTVIIYISEDKSLNFLKIDGYNQEEHNGVIQYKNIHYYEKAGNVHYTTDIHGSYSSFGGSMTGGNFSKLATVGGGLLFGFMGMALGATLTYKPAEQKPVETTFKIDSDIKKIDDRSVIINFYSDIKKQYVDIELPQDIFNFLQTYLPEKNME